MTDSATGVTSSYYYDLTNRPSWYAEEGEDFYHSVKYRYDEYKTGDGSVS